MRKNARAFCKFVDIGAILAKRISSTAKRKSLFGRRRHLSEASLKAKPQKSKKNAFAFY